MGQTKIIEHMLLDRDMSKAEVARAIGTKPENLYAKLKNDNLRENELIAIANAMDCDLEIKFIPRNHKQQ